MRPLLRLVVACVLAVAGPAQAAEPAAPIRVLFVGNSYLYTNDLPEMVRVLALSRGVEIETTMRAEPDYALADHLRRHGFDTLLAGDWDWIVLQQGPSGQPESRRELIASVRRILSRVQQAPAPRVALMSAWPALRYVRMSPQAEASYRAAAEGTRACVMPVATAWRLGRDREGMPALYSSDELHPTPHGTALAAMVVTDGLLGLAPTPVGAPTEESEVLAWLREAAQEAVVGEPAACMPGPASEKMSVDRR